MNEPMNEPMNELQHCGTQEPANILASRQARTAQKLTRLRCNRMAGHPGDCRHYVSTGLFRVVSSWTL